MSDKKKNFKFLGLLVFLSVFMLGGLFANVGQAQVSTKDMISIDGSFSSKKTIIYSVDGATTVITVVGCAKGSGDIYDMNTGKICTNDTSRSLLVGCRAGSGDVYNINTGKVCANDTKATLISCQAGSSDIYDINTGKLCLNYTSATVAGCIPGSKNIYNTNTGKLCPAGTTVASNTQNDTRQLAIVSKTDSTVQTVTPNKGGLASEISPLKNEYKEILSDEIAYGDDSISGREKMANSLSASAEKAGSIFKGPMSLWIILLIIIIILAGGYGVYSFNTLNTKKEDVEVIAVKSTETPVTPKTNPINLVNEQKSVPNNNNNNNNNPQPTPNTNTNTNNQNQNNRKY